MLKKVYNIVSAIAGALILVLLAGMIYPPFLVPIFFHDVTYWLALSLFMAHILLGHIVKE